jgi:hypothetical protein
MLEAAERVRRTGRSDSVATEHGNLYDHLERWMDVSTVRRIRTTYVEPSRPEAPLLDDRDGDREADPAAQPEPSGS